MAIHDIWWNPLICWVVDDIGLSQKSIEGDWDSVELESRYEFVHVTVIVAIVQYLIETVPPGLLADRELLFRTAAPNAGVLLCDCACRGIKSHSISMTHGKSFTQSRLDGHSGVPVRLWATVVGCEAGNPWQLPRTDRHALENQSAMVPIDRQDPLFRDGCRCDIHDGAAISAPSPALQQMPYNFHARQCWKERCV